MASRLVLLVGALLIAVAWSDHLSVETLADDNVDQSTENSQNSENSEGFFSLAPAVFGSRGSTLLVAVKRKETRFGKDKRFVGEAMRSRSRMRKSKSALEDNPDSDDDAMPPTQPTTHECSDDPETAVKLACLARTFGDTCRRINTGKLEKGKKGGQNPEDLVSRYVLQEKDTDDFCVQNVQDVLDAMEGETDAAEDFGFPAIRAQVCTDLGLSNDCCAADANSPCPASFCWSGYGENPAVIGWENALVKVRYRLANNDTAKVLAEFSMDVDKTKAVMCIKHNGERKCSTEAEASVSGEPQILSLSNDSDTFYSTEQEWKDNLSIDVDDEDDKFSAAFGTVIQGMLKILST